MPASQWPRPSVHPMVIKETFIRHDLACRGLNANAQRSEGCVPSLPESAAEAFSPLREHSSALEWMSRPADDGEDKAGLACAGAELRVSVKGPMKSPVGLERSLPQESTPRAAPVPSTDSPCPKRIWRRQCRPGRGGRCGSQEDLRGGRSQLRVLNFQRCR